MIRYALVWLSIGTLAAIVLIAVLRGGDGGEETVALPPVRQTELVRASRDAACLLRRPRTSDRTNPPIDGPPGAAPARPGVYDRAPATASLGAALRRGVIVIHYRTDLPDAEVEQLREVQRAVPAGTIVTPNATAMPFQFAVTAYRRLLGCASYSSRALDALRLFRGRYLGRGATGDG